ncbi:MAG: phosphoribosyltransferase family protein, partial [Candidatus Zixiibacteriota bacterium]
KKGLHVSGSDVVLIDDIISTGGSMIEAAKILRRLGAKSIHAACTHLVMAEEAVKKLKAAGINDVIATDTIETRFSGASVSPLIKEAIS